MTRTFAFRKTLIVLTVLIVTSLAHAAGEVDTSFLANLSSSASGVVNDILVQPDGKILAGGSFRAAGGYARAGLVRLNADGTVDTNFRPPDFFSLAGIGGPISVIALQSNGKILVGGGFQGANAISRNGLMRLNTDGSIDAAFNAQLNPGAAVYDIIVLPDDRILIAGNFSISSPDGTRSGIARLNADGSLDSVVYANSFIITDIVSLPDGKLIAASSGEIRRFNADGGVDASFTVVTVSGGSVQEMHLLPDGKIMVSGSFTFVNGFTLIGLFRVNTNGSIDTAFNPGGSGPNSGVNGITPAPGGKLLIFGGFNNYNSVARNRAALINADGSLDTSFNYTAHFFTPILDMAFLADGRILVAGPSSSFGPQNALARINADGTPDPTFNVQIGQSGSALTVLVQPDNKILAGGQFIFANGVSRIKLARFNPDGSLDTGFTSPSWPVSTEIYDVELQADGRILVGGAFGGGLAQRLNADGTYDRTFPGTNTTWDIQYLSDGKILMAYSNVVSRFNSDATLDLTFTPVQTNGRVYRMVVQPDGKLILVGTFTQINGANRSRIGRVNSDGSIDNTFITTGGANANINTAVLQPDGKIVIGGDFAGVNFDANKKYLARLNPDASLDETFAPVLNAPILGLKLQADGKILIGGAMSVVNGVLRPGIARLNSNGTLDAGFNTGSGTNSTVWDIDRQSDGKIIYVGQFSATNGISTLGIGRLLDASAPTRTLFDYDGDAKADISVFRASENRWYVFRSSDSVVSQTAFAIAGDVPVPADYDGDLKTDVAIYRPSNGAWWYLSSLNGAQINVNWGGEVGDIPRPSDFDGDGKSDFVFFRPTNNFWYRISSTGTVSNVAFGLAGDKPVRGDFDGDGKSDVAIYRPSTGDWWYQSSINNAQLAVRWGISTDIPAPADFDGDGRTDFAVFRPSTGVWYVINSSNGSFLIGPFGTPEDKPVPADYDGDGKAELAVFRPSSGVWYQLRTSGGFFAMQFGVGTDTPTPNAFVP